MKLISLKIQNFLLIEKGELSFEPGLFFIEGQNHDASGASSNFSGKSSIIEAMVWVLYGKTLRDISVNEVVNNKRMDTCFVTLIFEQTGHVYRVERTRAFGLNGKSSLEFFMDGIEITKAQKTQDEINRVFGIGYDAFINTCVFAHNSPFKFITMPNAQQKKIIESLVDLSQFEAYLATTRNRINELNKQGTELNSEETVLHERNRGLTAERDRIDAWICTAEQQNKAVIASENIKYRMKSAIDEDVASCRKDLAVIEFDLSAKQVEKQRLSGEFTQHSRLRTEHYNKVTELAQKKAQKNCPTCNQPMPAKNYDDLIDQERAKQSQEDLLIKEASAKITPIESDIKVLLEKRAKHNTVLDKLLRETAAESVTKQKLEDTSKYSGRLVEIDTEQDQLKARLGETDAEKQKILSKISYYRFLEKAFSRDGIESYLLDQILPFLNERANLYSSELSDGRISVHFATLKETKSGSIKDEFHVKVRASEGAFSYGGCSGSEERWADLSVSLAKRDLCDISVPSGCPPILMLDEIFDTIDEVASTRVIGFLKRLSSKVGTIWVISHNSDLKQYFENSITVVRKGGVSRIMNEGAEINVPGK